MQSITDFENRFGHHTGLTFKQSDGLIQLFVQNTAATATIALQGAQLIQWQPDNHAEVIWLSNASKPATGKSLRGGIPVCWPWFGAHKNHSGFPAHGFARYQQWQLESINSNSASSTELTFSLPSENQPEEYWPHRTTVQLIFKIGRTLNLQLITQNINNETCEITQALHTYFRVGDIREVTLHGLEDQTYLDKLEDFAQFTQKNDLTFASETDRIYVPSATNCTIDDPVLNRKIIIEKTGSNSTVVWNPWQETAEKMGDLGHNGYKSMLCVESANAASDAIKLKPHESHTLEVNYRIE